MTPHQRSLLVPTDDPVLNGVAHPIVEVEFSTASLIERIARLCSAFDSFFADRLGVGLAAPQIGVSERIFVAEDYGPLANGPVWQGTLDRKPFARVVMCNPQLLSSSDETVTAWETCLSEPQRIGLVSRPRRITMAFQDSDGVHYTLEAADWVARILCHEADHLDGCLCSRRYRPGSAMQTTAYVNEWRNRPLSDALAYFAGQGVR